MQIWLFLFKRQIFSGAGGGEIWAVGWGDGLEHDEAKGRALDALESAVMHHRVAHMQGTFPST